MLSFVEVGWNTDWTSETLWWACWACRWMPIGSQFWKTCKVYRIFILLPADMSVQILNFMVSVFTSCWGSGFNWSPFFFLQTRVALVSSLVTSFAFTCKRFISLWRSRHWQNYADGLVLWSIVSLVWIFSVLIS